MSYKIKKVSSQYGVYEVIDTGEYLVVSCNSKSNAELIVDILNVDLDSKNYAEENNSMYFPNTFEEFAKQYTIIDEEKVYTNGIALIPLFRVIQWLENLKVN